MTIAFRPAGSFTERHGLFVALAGGTNSGKTFSALRLARGIAGPSGKIAVVDTEGGRTLHLKKDFQFDVMMLDPPHRPERYAEAARAAEDAGYDVLVIDSFSMEWVGLGGVLDWQSEEFERMGSREALKLASWIKPKMAHKAMVYGFLQRRMPIVFSMRAEEKAKKEGRDVKAEWAPICNKAFPFEVTVSFMLQQDRQGVIDLSLPHKMEGQHRSMFRDGDQLSEQHGELLARWARGESVGQPQQQAAKAPAMMDLEGVGSFPRTGAGATAALDALAKAGPALIRQHSEWVEGIAAKVPSLADRCAEVLAAAQNGTQPAADDFPGDRP